MSEAETLVESAPAAPEPVAVLTPGRTLAEARARRNQTVAEIAQQLKLSASQVEALEADDYARLPGPVFVRGFIRNYARLVELDGEALVAALALPQDALTAGAAIPHSHNIPFPDGRGARWPYFAAAIGVLALTVVLFEFIMAPGAVAPTPEAAPAAPAATTEAPAQAAAQAPIAPAAPAAAAPEAAPQAIEAADASAPAAAEAVAAQPSKPARRAGEAELQFVFETQSWVEVRDRDDRILFSQLNPAGAVQHLQAMPPLNVVVGNARGVRLTYNGRPFDLAPHTRVEVARFTLE